MGKKFVSLFSIIVIAVMLLSASVVSPQAATRTVDDMSIFKGTKFDAHYRVPNEGAIRTMLEEESIVLPGASAGIMSQGVADFMKAFIGRNPDVSNPFKLKELLDFESLKASTKPVKTDRSIKSLVTLVEFPKQPEGRCAAWGVICPAAFPLQIRFAALNGRVGRGKNGGNVI